MKQKIKIRQVDFLNNQIDFETLILGSLGRSTQFIQSQTGYSAGQIAYRLKKQKIKRADYRNGLSELSERLLNVERKVAGNYLRKKI